MTAILNAATFKKCVVAALALTCAQSFAGVPKQKDDLFSGTERFAVGAKDSTEVNLDKNMLSAAASMKGGPKGELMSKMDFVFVHTYSYAKPGSYDMKDVEAFSKRLEGNGWSHLVKERSAKESTDICVKTDREGQMTELVVIDAEPLELDFVHLKGQHLSLSDLSKVGPGVVAGSLNSGQDDGKFGTSKPDPKLKQR